MEVRYHPQVVSNDLPKISSGNKLRIRKAIENKLVVNPVLYGEPLRGTLIPLWKLRVGDYRIVYGIQNETIYIHAIGHRKEIYDKIAPKRERLVSNN